MHGVELVQGVRSLTDTCTILLPQNIKLKDKTLKDLVQKNDPVSVRLGYDGNLNTVFEGYATRTEQGSPFRVHCEDAACLLKKNTTKATLRSPTLDELVRAMNLPIPYRATDMRFGQFRLSGVTAAKALEELQATFGIDSTVHDGVLYVGSPLPKGKRVVIRFQQDVVSHSLAYRLAEETAIQVKCLSLQPDNSLLEVVVGDGGEEFKHTYYNITKSDLQNRSEAIYEQHRYDGYRGDINTFGIPFIRCNDTLELIDDEYTERGGVYKIESITTTFGMNGFRRGIKIGAKI